MAIPITSWLASAIVAIVISSAAQAYEIKPLGDIPFVDGSAGCVGFLCPIDPKPDTTDDNDIPVPPDFLSFSKAMLYSAPTWGVQSAEDVPATTLLNRVQNMTIYISE